MRETSRRHHLARQLRGEATVQAAAEKALTRLGDLARRQLDASGMDPAVLDQHQWQQILDDDLAPVIRSCYVTAWLSATARVAAAVPSPEPEPLSVANAAADAYMTRVRNRLVGVSDTVYKQIVDTLREGREAVTTAADGTPLIGESIRQLAARVNGLLSSGDTWRGRAQTIARTEVIGANNAGSHAAAVYNADVLDTTPGQVQKEWLATSDEATRETHADADGQTVAGLDSPFTVGDAQLQYPGDEDGPPEEVINCRCTTLYHYPGDPDYDPDAVTASAGRSPHAARRMHTVSARQETQMTATPPEPTDGAADEPTSVVVVALPALDDPCNPIGGQQKHATVLFFGDVPGSAGDTPNPGLTADFQTTLTELVQATATATDPFSEDVTGVESLGDDGARVWMLDGSQLAPLRDALTTGTIPDVLSQVDQFPSYTPHVTIDYPPDAPADARTEEDDDAPDADDSAPDAPVDTTLLDPAVETAAAGITSISFDRLALWWAGDQTEFPLGAAATTAAAGEAAPTVQAGEAGEPAPTVDPMMVEESESDQFYGVSVVEDSQTGDGRVFGTGSLTWDQATLPMPLGWQVADAPGHDGSVVCGRIDTIIRFGNRIGYTGTWDVGGAGYETRRLVEGMFLRGISVDTDDIDVVVVAPDGTVLDPMAMMFGDADDAVLLVQAARIRSAVMCRVPAFTEAFIANGPPPAGWAGEAPAVIPTVPEPDMEAPVAPAPAAVTAALVAAAVAADLPARALPSYAEFCDPQLEGPTRLTVTSDGRVYGHLATWGVCHIGIQGECVMPDDLVSDTNYAHFTRGKVETDQGFVAVGPLTMNTGHPGLTLGAQAAIAHYDNTGTAVAHVAVGNDAYGIWVAGRIDPGVTEEQVYAIRAAGSISGDWRPLGTCSELVAALIVNVPGFPIPEAHHASTRDGVAMVASGVIRPAEAPTRVREQLSESEFTRMVAQSIQYLGRRDKVAARAAHRRASAARARMSAQVNKTRVAAAAARLNRER